MAALGIVNRVGVIDLTKGEVTYQAIPDQLVKDVVGGYGFGAWWLLKNQPAGVDPLGPEAHLGLTTGPLTGTDAITGNRFAAVGKSPKTGGWGDANCGGVFGPAMKKSGFDHLFVTGVASEPVVIVLKNGQATIEPAGEMWGKGAVETEDMITAKYGPKAHAACIGPAGERCSLLACIINDKGRAAGRSGLGAVMGAKRVKAVVAFMEGDVEVADPEGMKELRKKTIAGYKGNPGYDLFHNYGTAGVCANSVLTGDGPVRNWSGASDSFPQVDKISDDAVIAWQEKGYGCWRCPLACGGHMKVPNGPRAGMTGHKPEYETLAAFGSMCCNEDLSVIVEANNICNDYGVDTIATGTTVAYIMELYDRGIVSAEDLGGVDAEWGDAEAVAELCRQLGSGKGKAFELFGDGMKKAAERIGGQAGEYVMAAGGEELPMHDPRCKPGLGASYVIDATPGRHTQMSSWSVEDGFIPPGLNPGKIEDKYNPVGKGKVHFKASNFGHCYNSAGLCMFATQMSPADNVPKFLSLATGLDYDMDDVQEIGARAAALRMAFNAREGFRNLTDAKLPDRVLGKPPLESGVTAGKTIDNETEIMEYLEAAGWSKETGYPTRSTLEKLGLGWVADQLGDRI